jgi:hypothetical protein
VRHFDALQLGGNEARSRGNGCKGAEHRPQCANFHAEHDGRLNDEPQSASDHDKKDDDGFDVSVIMLKAWSR